MCAVFGSDCSCQLLIASHVLVAHAAALTLHLGHSRIDDASQGHKAAACSGVQLAALSTYVLILGAALFFGMPFLSWAHESTAVAGGALQFGADVFLAYTLLVASLLFLFFRSRTAVTHSDRTTSAKHPAADKSVPVPSSPSKKVSWAFENPSITGNPGDKRLRRSLCDETSSKGPLGVSLAGGSDLSSREAGDLTESHRDSGGAKEQRPAAAPVLADVAGVDSRGPSDSPIEILSVDDDRMHHRAVQKILQQERGIHLLPVSTAQGCLDLLEQRYNSLQPSSAGQYAAFPTMILMDINLGSQSWNGVWLVKEIRKRYPDAPLPIIMVTGADQAGGSMAESLQAGADDIIFKPFKSQDLKARILAQLRALRFWQGQLAHQRSQLLLKEILPDSIIERLNSGQRLIYDHLDTVSILFSDIVGFTDLASSVPTESLIYCLDELFNEFDELTDKHGVYKVETIGDAYMVVAGHEEASKADHAQRLLNMAADMIDVASRITMPNGKPLRIRVGVHSGPAYAGVVGHKTPRYCLFGDTVNVASRMESNSFPQSVHVSNSTMECYLQQAPAGAATKQFGFLRMGPRTIKGKGLMETWLVEGVGRAAAEYDTFMATIELHGKKRSEARLRRVTKQRSSPLLTARAPNSPRRAALKVPTKHSSGSLSLPSSDKSGSWSIVDVPEDRSWGSPVPPIE